MLTIVRFELSRHFRAISTYVYFTLLAALAYLLMITAGGTFQSVNVVLGAGKVVLNSPYTLAVFISLVSYFGLLIVSAIAGKAAFQDFEYQTHSLFFTAPISKAQYLGGRFIGSILALLAIFSGIAVGAAIGTVMPFIDKTRFGPNHLWAYVEPYFVTVIPNLLVMGALFFGLAALMRRILPVYMTSVILLIGYLIATSTSARIEEKFLAALLDPFGQIAMDRVTEYWTVSEKNVRMVTLEGALAWNRLLWLGVAAAVFAFTFVRFKFVYAIEGRPAPVKPAPVKPAPVKPGVEESAPIAAAPAIVPSFSKATFLRAMWRLTRLGFTETVKNIYFAVIMLAGILFMIAAARSTGDIYGTPTYPVTYQMIELIGGSFGLFILIIITFYSGELVWRERDARTHELIDALPLPAWVLFFPKLLALFLVQVLLMAVVMGTTISIQLAKGYTHIEPALYIKELFGLRLIGYFLLCVLAITVQTLVNNKYLGWFVMVLYYLASAFMAQLGFEHRLYRYASNPGYTYSDMNHFGPFLSAVFWFDAYWSVFAILLTLVASLFLVRGLATEWRWRGASALDRFRAPERAVAIVAISAFTAIGGFIFYNTNVLNPYRTEKQRDLLNVRYERDYKKYLAAPQPRITAVKFSADIYPESRSVKIRGQYQIANKTSQPVDTILVTLPENVDRYLTFHPPATLASGDRPLQAAIYRMNPPLAPGASGTLDFELSYAPRGFGNGQAETGVVENGTFFNSTNLPHFGYQDALELSDDNTRRKYGLAPKPRMADLNDAAARANTYIANDADWVTFDATLSTDAGQIAVAPGELVRDWTEGNRHYFEYRTLGKVLDFSSVLSARYTVLRDRWHDVDLGIYYQPGHEYNLARMMKGMKAALEYCTANFSPYQNKTLRIVEFPRYASFAQSFPASIPYSESIGFIARVDPKNDEDVNYPFYVTAHEVAHQWWAHQVIGANVQGSTLMSESLAQYTAMMVMKHEVGADQMRRFLKYEMDRYLIGRAIERKKELPLERVENQGYIHYNKASVVFYALQDYAGEENVNRALHDYVQAVAFQNPPYTISTELIDRLRKIVPPQYAYIIPDMFESITLYENRAIAATYRPISGGKYEVKLKVESRKVKSGELGEEKEVPLADWIDIGVLDSKGKPLYMEKHKIERRETEFTIIVDGVPAKAGIDPWNKLVDRKPDDNVIAVTKG
ncbi:MAG TPA: M1 family aminopeptidase [Bryobacteraceae bacterium]|nr:M1 family aminopeptidase [Bryobacteraceae bacterium]